MFITTVGITTIDDFPPPIQTIIVWNQSWIWAVVNFDSSVHHGIIPNLLERLWDMVMELKQEIITPMCHASFCCNTILCMVIQRLERDGRAISTFTYQFTCG